MGGGWRDGLAGEEEDGDAREGRSWVHEGGVFEGSGGCLEGLVVDDTMWFDVQKV